MRARLFPFIVLFGLAGSVRVFGDGGVLTYRSTDGELEEPAWHIERQFLQSSEKATIRLDGEDPEDVFVVDSGGPAAVRMIVTRDERIYCDLDGDGSFRSDERLEGETGYTDEVSLPYRIRDGVPSIVCYLGFYAGSENCRLYTFRIRSFYEGRLNVTGGDYAARMAFRSAFPDGSLVNEVVVLDTNRDDVFDPFVDQWFSSEGIAYLDDSLWVARTVFSASEAEVSLAPYTGPTGHLAIEGGGLRRAFGRLEADTETGIAVGRAFGMCLGHRPDQTYVLPTGAFRVDYVWLDGGTRPGIFYRFHNEEPEAPAGATARIPRDATVSLRLGGPLTERVKASVAPLSRNVALVYAGCTNPAGLEYRPATAERLGRGRPNEGPPYEVRGHRGELVASGNFEYG